MPLTIKKDFLPLFLGDIVIFAVSLYLALFLRYLELPDRNLFLSHLLPFGILSALWVFVFFIAGLYEKHTLLLKGKLPQTLFNAQVVNAFVAVIFFYLIPQFGIEPKTNLFIYLVLTSALTFVWRLYGFWHLVGTVKQKAMLIGSGDEVLEIKNEVNNNPRYALNFISTVNLDHVGDLEIKEEIINRVYSENVTIIVVDFDNKKLESIITHLYSLLFTKVRFVDMHNLYEDIFDRVPISLLRHSWFLENISLAPKNAYESFKRAMDIFISGILGICSLVLYPFVYLVIKLDDGGSVFFIQERVGRNNHPIHIRKFRTMKEIGNVDVINDKADRVTKIGKFLRKSRIDELPQLWNVLKGDLSLIGPRPELPQLVKIYDEEIPFYNIRHLITPGISGWAQLYHENHPHHGSATIQTKEKLSYDFYYIKNRSAMLDLKIALKTIKALLSRSGA